jgi:hypothetical protein
MVVVRVGLRAAVIQCLLGVCQPKVTRRALISVLTNTLFAVVRRAFGNY